MSSQPTALSGPWCQRWRGGKHSWRHRSDGGLDPRSYDVARIDEATAKTYVIANHYSKTFPATAGSHRYGLFERGHLVGVAVFGVPMSSLVLTNVFAELSPNVESLELSRFVLDDAVPGNGETMFLAQVFRQAADHGLRGVVSFADPAPRRRSDGTTVMPGHVGIIYQAKGAIALGRGTPRSLIILGDGTVLTARSAQKVRAGEVGHEYVERRLIALGAKVPRAGANMKRWLTAALDDVGARRVRHLGPYRYAFKLGNRSEQRRARITMSETAYPKLLDAPL